MRFKNFVLVLVLLVLSFSTFATVYADVELNTIEGPGNVPFYLSRFVEFADETGIKVNLNVIPLILLK